MLTRAHAPAPRAASPALPSFPGGRLFHPEPALRKILIRAVALLALASSLAYLVWRLLFTIDPAVAWIAVPFFLLEAHAVISLALFTFSLWEIDSLPPARPVTTTTSRIAVFIPTYNESAEILLPTIAAAVSLKPEHETYVLDDGNRPDVRKLAADLGARYIARPDNSHAKAGNINHALALVHADFVAILDADHVARPNFLRNTLGYFDDPRVVLVQTPQDFYNLDSFEHESGAGADEAAEKDRYHEEGLFYRVIQPGKNRWGAAFWCGTGAVLRLAALRDAGGLATETITEDIHTTVRLHRRGWRTVYHNEVLARGLAARTAAEYQLQRYRWGTGAMQLLRRENPLTVPGLRFTQRLSYAATLLGWFEAWRSLGYLLVPVLVLLTGAVPVRARPEVFLPAFVAVFVLQQLALRVLSRGYHRALLPIVFELVRMTPNLLATLNLATGGRRKFQVTPKGRLDDERRRVRAPVLLIAIVVLGAIAAAFFGLAVAGWIPFQYQVPWAAYAAAFWLAFNTALVLAAIARVRSLRFGAERRSSVRFDTALRGTLDLAPCTVLDVSLAGALVRSPAMSSLETNGHSRTQMLTIHLGKVAFHLKAVQRSRRLLESGNMLCGLEFVQGQEHEQAKLALALFNAQIVPEIVSQSGPLHSAGAAERDAPDTRPAPARTDAR